MASFLSAIRQRFSRRSKSRRAQSYVELALILPVLLIMLLGMVEIAFLISRYLDVLDLTREAARFASVRDPFAVVLTDKDCSTENLFDFYYDASCILSPPADHATLCNDPKYCNGLNANVYLDPNYDDVVISVFTVSGNIVTNTWPRPNGYWAYSENDNNTTNDGNWKKDCEGNVDASAQPYFTQSRINTMLQAGSPPNKGFVAVEFFYCYHQLLRIPVFTAFVPDPMRIHAYTIMPLPAAQPTATTTVNP